MKLRACISLFALVLFLNPVGLFAAEKPQAADSDRQLSIRLSQQAQSLARVEKITEAHLRKMAAMLDAARKCDPRDVQVLRMHLELSQKLNDLDSALEDLKAIRELAPGDQSAQLDTVAIYLSRIESVDKKLAYLQGVMASGQVPAEVRSIIANKVALLLEENGRKDEALKTLDEAVKLNPLNYSAHAMIFERRASKATDKQRFSMLISMVRANPTIPSLLQLVGQSLAQAGMAPESTVWFKAAVDNAAASKNGLTLEMMIDLAASQMLSDRIPQAQEVLDEILALAPSDYVSLILRSMAEEQQGKPESRKYIIQARNVLINNFNECRSKLGFLDAATRPINEGEIFMPDPASDAKALEKADPQKRAAYILSLVELAWFEVFFNDKPDQADKLYAQILSMLSDQERNELVLLPRIAGWIYLKQKRFEDAKIKFAVSSERDSMAELGLILALAEADKKTAAERGAKLIDDNAAGVNAVVIVDRLKSLGVRPKPTTLAPDYIALLNTLPQNWMSINTRPATFYSLRVDPVNISTPFGQPIIVNITLQNTGNVDLSIGADGVIQPGVWIDAQVTGVVNTAIPGVAFQSLNDTLVLKARQSIKTTARIDQSQLAGLLDSQPSAAISIRVIARTNPVFISGAATSGPAGFVTDRSSPFQRAAFPVNTETLSKTLQNAASGPAAQRFASIQLLTQLLLTSQSNPNPLVQSKTDEILKLIDNASKDPADPALAAWAGYNLALITPPAAQLDAIRELLKADKDWRSQMMGLYALDALGVNTDQQKNAAEKVLGADPKPQIKAYADALLKILSAPKP